jgi:sugar/nucleoside kinase (ribokinase family)
VRVSMDLNWDPCWGEGSHLQDQARKKAVGGVLPMVNLVHGNVRELKEFSEATDLDTALNRLTAWGAQSVVIHMGEKGAGFFDGKTLLLEPPVQATSQKNSTGTGDVLSVCMILLDRLVEIPLRDRLHLSNSLVSEFMEGGLRLIPEIRDEP